MQKGAEHVARRVSARSFSRRDSKTVSFRLQNSEALRLLLHRVCITALQSMTCRPEKYSAKQCSLGVIFAPDKLITKEKGSLTYVSGLHAQSLAVGLLELSRRCLSIWTIATPSSRCRQGPSDVACVGHDTTMWVFLAMFRSSTHRKVLLCFRGVAISALCDSALVELLGGRFAGPCVHVFADSRVWERRLQPVCQLVNKKTQALIRSASTRVCHCAKVSQKMPGICQRQAV